MADPSPEVRYGMRFIAEREAWAAVLEQQGLSPEGITRVTGLSPSLVARYRELVARYQGATHRPVWERLLRRYAPLDLPRAEPVTASEVGHG